jgi:acetyl-CoA carboxylase biotin carboxylase subunit
MYNGYTVPPYYDSLLAKILVHAPNRDMAIARMERALKEVRIEGIATNRSYLQRILQNEYFRRGEVSTDFLERRM